MSVNASQAANITLDQFLSLYTDMNPNDLPEGLSPDNQDIWYTPGSAATRPALQRVLLQNNPIGGTVTDGIGNATIASVADFPLGTGDHLTSILDSNGNLWYDNVAYASIVIPLSILSFSITSNVASVVTNGSVSSWKRGYQVIIQNMVNTYMNGTFTILSASGTTFTFAKTHANVGSTVDVGLASPFTALLTDTVTPGVYFKAENYANKQWYGFYGRPSLNFTNSQFAGVDITRFYDGINNVARVTQDAPGAAPGFGNLHIASVTLASSSVGSGVNITNMISAGEQIVRIPPPRRIPPVGGNRLVADGSTDPSVDTIVTFWTSLMFTTSTPHLLTVGSSVSLSGFTGANAIYNFSNAIVKTVPSSTTFTIAYQSDTQVTLSGSPLASITPTSPVMIRNKNIVTAFTTVDSGFSVGWYVKITDSAGGTVLQTVGGSISAIVRDTTNKVTVTLTAPITNLAIGTTLHVTGVTDTTNFPASDQKVSQIIQEGTTYKVVLDWIGSAASSSAGNLQEIWTGTFQIQSVSTTGLAQPFITFFQLGPDDGCTTGGMLAAPQSQITPGYRSAVCLFKSTQGAITGPSAPITVAVSGGSNFLTVDSLPIGPPGTAARIVAFTPQGGSNFYYITQNIIPSINGLPPVISLPTAVNDNTTISAVMDFSDAQLISGTQIDINDNNLFNQVVLGPSAGVIEYYDRLFWWGETNKTQNLVNMGFDGGYIPLQGIVNVAAQNVTWVSGDRFQNTMVGSQIFVNGSAFTVQAVFSSTSLTLTVPAPITVNNVPFYVILPTNPLGWTLSGPNIIPDSDGTGGTWTVNAPLTFNGGAGASGLGGAWQITGTGSATSFTVAASQTFTVVPGQTYTFSAYTTSTGAVTSTQPFWAVENPALSVTYALISSVGGRTSTVFTVPLGVTQVKVIADTNNCVITNGAVLSFSNPQLELGNTVTFYAPTGTGVGANLIDFPDITKDFGFALEFTPSSNSVYSQTAYQDTYGTAIIQPLLNYSVRLSAKSKGVATGNLIVDLFSPSVGTLATATFPVSQFSFLATTWNTQSMNAALPAQIPSDTILRVYVSNLSGNNIIIDELEVIDASRPILQNQLRVSYAQNPFGYDAISGRIILPTNDSIVSCFKLRSYLYIQTNTALYVTQNNGSTEPAGWDVNLVSDNCGCSSPNAVTVGDEVAWWTGRNGTFLFNGAEPKKISQEIQTFWDATNWSFQETIWMANDPINRMLFLGMPQGIETAPSVLLTMSYRAMDAEYNVPDPIHITFQGQIKASDLARKWTKWNVNANTGAMVYRTGATPRIVFGGGNGVYPGDSPENGFGQLYQLNFNQYTDDDFGQIFSYYTTFAMIDSEMELAMQTGNHRKLYTYLSTYTTGIGQLKITPLVDRLGNAMAPKPLVTLSTNLNHDIEWGLNVRGERCFFKLEVLPLANQTDAYMNLSKIVVSMRADLIFPVRGAL